jgi:hypothetical protein
MKKQAKKLKLAKETIALLTDEEALKTALGGSLGTCLVDGCNSYEFQPGITYCPCELESHAFTC